MYENSIITHEGRMMQNNGKPVNEKIKGTAGLLQQLY
jgi:hypothetical protein